MKNLTNVMIKNSNRKELTNRSALLGKLSFFIVFTFLSIIMIIFSQIATTRLAEINQSYAFVNMLLFMNFLIVFTESIFHSLNSLYFSKDLKIFLRLPIKAKELINSKMLDIIISEYQMELLMLAIPMTVYGIMSNVKIQFYLYMIIILLILPVIPIAITTLIVSIIMRFTNFMKNKAKVMYITIILAILMVGIFFAYLSSGTEISMSNFEILILKTNGIADEIANRFILIKPTMNILFNHDNLKGFRDLIIYIIESIIIYKIVVFIVSKLYFKGAIGTVINSSKDKKNIIQELSIQDFKKNKISKTYILKELKIIMRSPIFFIQCILMPGMYPVLVFLAINFVLNWASNIGINIANLVISNLENASIYAFFIAIGQSLYMLNFSTIIAVSKENRSSIMLKTLPISLDKQFKLKTVIGVISNLIGIFLVCKLYYNFSEQIIYTLGLFIILYLINIIGEKYKLLIDLRNPQIKWDTEYVMMKQNTNVMYTLFYTVLVIAGIVVISILLKTTSLYISIMIGILIIVNSIINNYISRKKEMIFGKLY